MSAIRNADQTDSHTVTITFDVAATSPDAVAEFIGAMHDAIFHHAYYSADISLVGNAKGEYTL